MLAAGQATAGSFSGRQFSYSGNGGTTQDAQNKIFGDFATVVGASYAPDGPPTAAKVKAQVDSGNVTWDIVDAPEVDLAEGCGTVYQKIDYSKLDTSKLSPLVPKQDCGIALNASPWTFAYDTEAFPQAPTSWADFFDLAKFPGKRAIYAGFPMQQIEIALLGSGVDPGKLAPPDVDAGYAELDKLKSDLVFYSAGSESQQMMASNQIVACICWSGRVYTEIQNGSHWALVPTAPPVLRMDYLAIPIGSKNTDVAYAAINYFIGAQQQAYWQEATGYPPMNVDAKPKLSAAAKAVDVFQPPFKPVTIDVTFWAGDLAAQMDKWTTWTSS
ncbi:ABC transporter [Nakamurella endophytica]|uniref:ABC transporter n=1 Tax=Nakamurella endophytica TaxID=1748367 RepID=A0A917SSM3_9ACTN|nr:ABC transporter [Nakamurella endophytica]